MSSQKIVVSKKPFCKVCHDCGKSETEYTSHYVRSEPGPNGKIVCPTLLAQECQHCFKKGHTRSHCKEISKLAAKERYIQSQLQPIIQKKPEKKKNVFEILLDEEEETLVKSNIKTKKTAFKEDFPALSGAPKSGAPKSGASVGASVATEAQNPKKRSYASIAKIAHEEAVQEEIIIEYIEKMKPKEIVKPTILVKPIVSEKPKSWAEYDSDDDKEEENLISASEYYKEYQDRIVKPVVLDAW